VDTSAKAASGAVAAHEQLGEGRQVRQLEAVATAARRETALLAGSGCEQRGATERCRAGCCSGRQRRGDH